jgi:hypothetical protein
MPPSSLTAGTMEEGRNDDFLKDSKSDGFKLKSQLGKLGILRITNLTRV